MIGALNPFLNMAAADSDSAAAAMMVRVAAGQQTELPAHQPNMQVSTLAAALFYDPLQRAPSFREDCLCITRHLRRSDWWLAKCMPEMSCRVSARAERVCYYALLQCRPAQPTAISSSIDTDPDKADTLPKTSGWVSRAPLGLFAFLHYSSEKKDVLDGGKGSFSILPCILNMPIESSMKRGKKLFPLLIIRTARDGRSAY